MSARYREQGFTLLEAVIALALTVTVLALGLKLLSKFTSQVAAFQENYELIARRDVAAALLAQDLENASRHLARARLPESGSRPLEIISDGNYTQDGANIQRAAPGDERAWAGTPQYVSQGDVSFTFTPPKRSWIGFSGAEETSLVLQVKDEQLCVLVNDEVVAQTGAAPDGLPRNDNFTFRWNITTTAEGRRAQLYAGPAGAGERLLYETAHAPAYPLQPRLALPDAGSILSGATLTSPALSNRIRNAPEVALLPRDRGERLAAPVQVARDGHSVTILSGATDMDTAYLASDCPNEREIACALQAWPAQGAVSEGDILLMADFGTQRSALLRVTGVSPEDRIIKAERVSRENAAWLRLWSDDDDGPPVFAAGASVIKLSPPVTYSFYDGQLLRLEGDHASIAAWGVADFTITETRASQEVSFAARLTLTAEDAASNGASRAEAFYQARPRALNLFNQSN